MAISRKRVKRCANKAAKPSYDTNRFRSEAHFKYFQSNIGKRPIISDVNFSIEGDVYHEIQDMIENRGWTQFVQIAGRGFQNLSYEFYANAWKDSGEEEWPKNTSYVRGKPVDFGVDIINDVLQTVRENHMEDSEFAAFAAALLDYKCVLATLCRPGADWGYDASANPAPKMLRIADLKPIPRVWCSFILRSFVPNVNDSELVIDRVKLLYAIVTGIEVDAGEIIHSRIEAIVNHKSASLAYPSVITLLCKHAGVLPDVVDVPIRAKQTITAARIREIVAHFKKRHGADSHTPKRQHIRRHRLSSRENFALLFHRQDVMQRNFRQGMMGLAKQIHQIVAGKSALAYDEVIKMVTFEPLPTDLSGNVADQDEAGEEADEDDDADDDEDEAEDEEEEKEEEEEEDE